MNRILLFAFLFLISLPLIAQNDAIWTKQSSTSITNRISSIGNDSELYYQLNEKKLKENLAVLGLSSYSSKKQTITVSFPNSDGILEKFEVFKTSNFDAELQAKYPEIQSYEGIAITNKKTRIYFSVAPIGIQAMTMNTEGENNFIENMGIGTQKYRVFSSQSNKQKLNCLTKEDSKITKRLTQTAKATLGAKKFKTIRLALSCTGEYTSYFGGTKAGALAGMNATLTRVNAIFNKDLSVRVVLIANNEDIIYTDASTDPYSVASTGSNGVWSLELQKNLTATIGNDNYDMGHLFGATGGGGDAGCIGCVCDNPISSSDANAKGSAFTSPADGKPEGDNFDVDFVAHEMAHQLGANHTFSYEIEGTGVSVEPGSGSTIMSYAGVSDGYDVQKHSDDYFAYRSILQIQTNLENKTCPVTVDLQNNPPVVNAGSDYTIPVGTAFVLKGTGSEGNLTTYCWEQNDTAITTSGAQSLAIPTKPDGPLFRSFSPTTSLIRYMPSLDNVLRGQLTSTWETVSTVARNLNFTLTARDNAGLGSGQTSADEIKVTVSANAGPFAVTSQNSDNESWTNGSQQNITWDVNNTNTLEGSSNVNIKISTDGGLNFDTTLVANTPNDGAQTITVPADLKGTDCRLLIEPIANIYYAVNSKSFAIGYTVMSNTETFLFAAPINIPDGDQTYTLLTVDIPAAIDDNGELISEEIVAVNVAMNFTHSYLSDVDSYIQNPAGTKVKLFDSDCDDKNTTLDLVYDDLGTGLNCGLTSNQSIQPTDALSVFNGNSAQGTWTFGIRDYFLNDVGILNSASLTIITKTFTQVAPEIDKDKFVIYSNPNPSDGNFVVELTSDSLNSIQIFVYDLLGEKVYERNFEPTVNFHQNIQLTNVSSGIYLVTVIDGNKKRTQKIIIR